MSLLYDVLDNLEHEQTHSPHRAARRNGHPLLIGAALATGLAASGYYATQKYPDTTQAWLGKVQDFPAQIAALGDAELQPLLAYWRSLPLHLPWEEKPIDVYSSPRGTRHYVEDNSPAPSSAPTAPEPPPAATRQGLEPSARAAAAAPAVTAAPSAERRAPSEALSSAPSVATPIVATPSVTAPSVSTETVYDAADYSTEMAMESQLQAEKPEQVAKLQATPTKKAAPPKTKASAPRRDTQAKSNPALSIRKSTDHSAKKLYNEALVLSKKGNARAAIGKLEQVLERDPKHYKAAIMASALLNDTGNYERSLQLLERAQSRNADVYPLQHQKAITLSQRGKIQEALAALQSSRPQSSKERLLNLHLMGSLHYQNQDFVRSTAIFKKALRYFPQSQDLWLGLAKSLQASKQTAAAERAYSYLSSLEALRPDIRAHLSSRQ